MSAERDEKYFDAEPFDARFDADPFDTLTRKQSETGELL
jgi:hypothetical protein